MIVAHALTGGHVDDATTALDLIDKVEGDVWVANYYSARNPLRLSSLVILGVVARMFRCATRSSRGGRRD